MKNKYFKDVYECDILTQEEEVELFERIRNGCVTSRDRVVTTHLRLVSSIARKYAKFGSDFDDLIQAGSIGILSALSGFDPNAGVRFSQYAIPFIRGEILYHIPNSDSIFGCKTTKSTRKLFYNLRKHLKVERNLTEHEIHQIATTYSVLPEEVVEMECLLKSTFHDINGEDREYWETFLVDETDIISELCQQEQNQIFRERICSFLEELDERSTYIVLNRILCETQIPLREISEKYSISVARVNQIEVSLLTRIKERFLDIER